MTHTRKLTTSAASADLREHVWSEIRARRVFVLDDLRVVLGIESRFMRAVHDYATGLVRAGFIKHLSGERYQLVRDIGPEAPQVNRDGRELQGQCVREAIWRAAKIMSEFTLGELRLGSNTESCAVSLADTRRYLRALVAAGYVQSVSHRGREAVYRFVPARNTGPRPPVVQHVLQVWDANDGKVVFRAGGEA